MYVAATRGRDDSLVLVVTDTHDLADAVEVLEQVPGFRSWWAHVDPGFGV